MAMHTVKHFLMFAIMLLLLKNCRVNGYPQAAKATARASADAVQSIGDGAGAVAVASSEADTDLKGSETFGFGYYPGIYGGGLYEGRGLGYGGYGYGGRWGYGGYHGYSGYGGYGGYGDGLYRRSIYPVWG
ncbi:glycine-rich RNA-binding protein 3, mitochondrial-like [Rhagoletis pomonella]|uniref:glycine-rich RNA-binding protein 3, mitochondrial-like n=1 Tax=Rhagoletis pomonella TaxID=28610 RepID=UPI00177CD7D2|nr:glycine-rich RNA-binding protein 3, mitochondrial-like [Rhagoletis pomonella]